MPAERDRSWLVPTRTESSPPRAPLIGSCAREHKTFICSLAYLPHAKLWRSGAAVPERQSHRYRRGAWPGNRVQPRASRRLGSCSKSTSSAHRTGCNGAWIGTCRQSRGFGTFS